VHLWGENFVALSRLWDSVQDFLMCSSCIIDIKLIYRIIVYRTVLVPKGWRKRLERGSSGGRKRRRRKGVVHNLEFLGILKHRLAST